MAKVGRNVFWNALTVHQNTGQIDKQKLCITMVTGYCIPKPSQKTFIAKQKLPILQIISFCSSELTQKNIL